MNTRNNLFRLSLISFIIFSSACSSVRLAKWETVNLNYLIKNSAAPNRCLHGETKITLKGITSEVKPVSEEKCLSADSVTIIDFENFLYFLADLQANIEGFGTVWLWSKDGQNKFETSGKEIAKKIDSYLDQVYDSNIVER